MTYFTVCSSSSFGNCSNKTQLIDIFLFAQKYEISLYGIVLFFLCCASAIGQNNIIDISEKIKTRILNKELTDEIALKKSEPSEEDIEKFNFLKSNIHGIAREFTTNFDDARMENLFEMKILLSQAEKKLEDFKQALKQKYPVFKSMTNHETLNSKNFSDALDQNEAFINYIFTDNKLIAIFVKKNVVKSYVLCDRKDVVLKTKNLLLNINNKSFHNNDANYLALSDMLLSSFKDELSGVDTLIISADGILNQLPIEILMLNKQLLFEQFKIKHAQTLTFYKLLKEKNVKTKSVYTNNLFAIGGAIYDNKSSTTTRNKIQILKNYEWTNLPGTLSEINSVTNFYDKNNTYVLIGEDASEFNIMKLNEDKFLQNYETLLFSTHAYVDLANNFNSSIVLSQNNITEKFDGYLNYGELISLKLNSDLIILSSCESSLGSEISGEGSVGLPYALYMAGNKSTMATLWPVDDIGTSLFIKTFFKYYQLEKLGIVDSLRQTKQDFINGKFGVEYTQPLYWSSFQYFGA